LKLHFLWQTVPLTKGLSMHQGCSPKHIRRRKRRKQRSINLRLKRQLLSDNIFGICCYCKTTFLATQLTIEHKVPICLGGTSDIENIDLACAPCNQSRGRQAWLFKKSLNKESYDGRKN